MSRQSDIIRANPDDYQAGLTFEKRRSLSSVDHLALFQHKIRQKSKLMLQDPAVAHKVRMSQLMKQQNKHMYE